MQPEQFLSMLDGVRRQGGGYAALCPAHEDETPSLSVFEGDRGMVVTCHTGCSIESIVQSMGLGLSDLFFDAPASGGAASDPEAIYPYVDEGGIPLFEAVRFPRKRFRQRHVNSEGRYEWGLDGVRRVLFQLPDVLQAAQQQQHVYLCEGEKDALNLSAQGVVATCNPMGAGKWSEEYTKMLSGAIVTIVQDKDEAGRHHALKVQDSLRHAGVICHIVEPREGKDASDHLRAGYGIHDFAPVIERVRRGIVTAREMAQTGLVQSRVEEGAITEYVVPDFKVGRHPLAFRQGRLYLLGGYTGDGKTTGMLQVVRAVCSDPVPPRVGVFSMEMSSDDLRNRIVQHRGLDLYKIEHPWLMSDDEKLIHGHALMEMSEWPLEIIFDTQLDAETMCNTTKDRGYDIVFLDHIHRFSWGQERRTFESEIVKLTNLGLDYNIPVFVLAQFRNFATGKGMLLYPRPTLQDFKETGALGQEAALAMAIYRHRDQTGEYLGNQLTELIVLKNRFGPTSAQMLQLQAGSMTFGPMTMEAFQPQPMDVNGSSEVSSLY